MEARNSDVPITDKFTGPDIAELSSYADDIGSALQWRRSRSANCMKLVQRRRYLYEQRNDHLMQLDLQDAALIAERRRAQALCLAYAARIEMQLDPATRDGAVSPARASPPPPIAERSARGFAASPAFDSRSGSVFQPFASPARSGDRQYSSALSREPLRPARAPKFASRVPLSPLREHSSALSSNHSAFFPMRENKFTPLRID